MFDIILISGNKDLNKLKYVYNSIITNITDKYDNIYLISPEKYHINDNVINYTDDEVLKINRGDIKYRPNWIYQQYLKLFQNISKNDYYLIVDADIIFNRPITIFDKGKPTFFFGANQNHQPYFNYTKQMLGINKKHPLSFINEFMLFDKNVIDKILLNFNNDKFEFIQKSNDIVTNDCYISEYELYGNFVYNKFKDKYNYKNLNYYNRVKPDIWSDGDIERLITTMKRTQFDIFTIHTNLSENVTHSPLKNTKTNFSSFFTNIYEKNMWGNGSGGGSTIESTVVFRGYIESFIKDNNIKTVIDYGCGDWRSTKLINWNGANYIGYDCVKSIIDFNINNYTKDNIKFEHKENLEDFFNVKSDLLIIKDVLQHWTNKDIEYFLQNIKNNFNYIIIVNTATQKHDYQIEPLHSRPLSAKFQPLIKYGAEIVATYYCQKGTDLKEISIIKNI